MSFDETERYYATFDKIFDYIYKEFSDETIEKINQMNERKFTNMEPPKDWNNAPEKMLQNILKTIENKTNNHKQKTGG